MKKDNKKIITILLFLFAGFFIFFNAAPPALALDTRTVTVGTGSGSWGSTVSVPVTVDNPSGIGGIAFTLNFSPDIFQFNSIVQVSQTVSDGSDYWDSGTSSYVVPESGVTEVGTTLFYQANPDNVNGKVLVAAASATALTQGTLFNARFTVKQAGDGNYTIGIVRTIINNPEAGYNGPTYLPVLVGVPVQQGDQEVYPQYTTVLKGGSITVTPPPANVYTISGSVTYQGDGSAANGTPVTLKKLAGNDYIYDGATTVQNGSYTFSNKLNGSYKVFITSLNPGYYSSNVSVNVSGSNATANVILPAPIRASGTLTINGGFIAGLKVKVVDGNGQTVGTFPVNENGTFISGPLPPGTYTTYAVYGSLTQLFDRSSPYNWTTTLYNISGTLTGVDTGVATITAGSLTGGLLRTTSGTTTYTIPNLVPANNYRVSGVAPGNPVLYYNQKTDITQAGYVDISGGNGTADFDFTSVSKATISGTVYEGESPLSNTMVFTFDLDTFALRSTQTDQSGAYTFMLAPGCYEVFIITAEGEVYYYADSGATQKESNATKICVTAGNTYPGKDITITALCNETLIGTVTYEGSADPVANALITATSADDMEMTLTGRNGAYTLTGLCDGDEYTVEMDPIAGNFGIQTETITAGTDKTLNFVIDTGQTLSGTVTDFSSGVTIANTMIYLINQETQALVGGRMYFSDNSGGYTINDIPSGIYTIIASHPEYRTYEETDVSIETDETRDIELVKGAFFYGTVLDGSNGDAALRNGLVIVTRSGGVPLYDVTDRNGYWDVYGLDDSQNDYIVLAQKKDYEREVAINQQPAEDTGTEVPFTLNKPTEVFNLSGTITSSCSGTPPVADAIVIVSSVSKKFFAKDTTDENGDYSFTDLPESNDYRFVILPGGDLQAVVTTGLDYTGAVDEVRDVEIPCGSTITGMITWTGSSTAFVFLYKTAGEFVGYTTVDTSGGTYTFNGLSGDYKVFALASGNTPEWYSGKFSILTADEVSAGDSGIDIDLTD